MPETRAEELRRRAEEARARLADARVTNAADEIRADLAETRARVDGLFGLMEATVEAAGLAPAEPGRPQLRLIKGDKAS